MFTFMKRLRKAPRRGISRAGEKVFLPDVLQERLRLIRMVATGLHSNDEYVHNVLIHIIYVYKFLYI